MPCCGQSSALVIDEGRHIQITGIPGSTQEPFTISATTELDVEPNQTFVMRLTGDGTLDSPWRLEVLFAGTASINDLPDVNTSGATNGQVLALNISTGRWEPAPPAITAPGLIVTGLGLTGDGSAPSPLTAVGVQSRFVQVGSSGISLTNGGIRSLHRQFNNAAARAAADPVEAEGNISSLLTEPGRLQWFDGAAHHDIITPTMPAPESTGQMLSLSGAYAGGPIKIYTSQLSVTTDSTGAFEVIPSEDLESYSGVLSCHLQETGAGVPWKAMLAAGTANIIGIARRLDTGATYPGAVLTGVVTAHLY